VRQGRNGRPIVTDGPFAETKEQLGSYYVVECANREEAEAIAREIRRARGSSSRRGRLRTCEPSYGTG
jgi:hypothetical protein